LFLADTSSDAYDKLVDRLLASTAYGERMAWNWLDAAHYADTNGYQGDGERTMWPWRDWVVDSFNNNMPFEQFSTLQLAGDLLPEATFEQKLATGFCRNHMINGEGGRIAEENRIDYVTDMSETMGTVWLGLTLNCCRCHDHKFDPILQEDYFRLQACFGTMVPRDDIPAADLIDRQRYSQQYEAWLAKAADLRKQLHDIREPYMQKAARGAIERFPEDIQQIMAKPIGQRTPLDAQLADLVDRQVVFDQERAKIKDEDKTRIEELEKQIAELAGKEPAKLPVAMTVADLGTTPQTIHLAANPNRKVVSAGGFSILDSSPFDVRPTTNSTGQRTALANWIANLIIH